MRHIFLPFLVNITHHIFNIDPSFTCSIIKLLHSKVQSLFHKPLKFEVRTLSTFCSREDQSQIMSFKKEQDAWFAICNLYFTRCLNFTIFGKLLCTVHSSYFEQLQNRNLALLYQNCLLIRVTRAGGYSKENMENLWTQKL